MRISSRRRQKTDRLLLLESSGRPDSPRRAQVDGRVILHRQEREEKPRPEARRRKPPRLSPTERRPQEEPTIIPSLHSLPLAHTYHRRGRTLDQTLSAPARFLPSGARRKVQRQQFESQPPPVLLHRSLLRSHFQPSLQSQDLCPFSQHLSSQPDGHSPRSQWSLLRLRRVQPHLPLTLLPERFQRGKSPPLQAPTAMNLDQTRSGPSLGSCREGGGVRTRSFEGKTRQKRRLGGGTVNARRQTSRTRKEEVPPISTSSEQEDLRSRIRAEPLDASPTQTTLFNEHLPTPLKLQPPPSSPLSTVTLLSQPPTPTARSIDDHPSECEAPPPTTP